MIILNYCPSVLLGLYVFILWRTLINLLFNISRHILNLYLHMKDDLVHDFWYFIEY